jgi:serine/threonine protein kinase
MSRIIKSPDGSCVSSLESCDEESIDELQQFVEFSDFPVQVTLLERLEGTMDELLEAEDEEDPASIESKDARWSSWLFQVIAGLTTAQYLTGFVHNDLHTNNIMWSTTDRTHLYYRIHKQKETYYMAVPTYGKIMKIIDFGRASYTLPEPAGFFISDAFYPGNDAATQYNCEPFYDPEDGKKVEPSTSFDLCRLAVSLLESLYPERPAACTPTKVMSREGAKIYTETVSGIYNMMWQWLTDDDGKNVLRSPDGEERYPDFDLYRALATDVHKAIPKQQIERSVFAGYKVAEPPKDVSVYDLHI